MGTSTSPGGPLPPDQGGSNPGVELILQRDTSRSSTPQDPPGYSTDKDSSRIYELYSIRQRTVILTVISAAALLVPFCDTVYLPALAVVQSDLHTNMQLVAASVSIYMYLVGVAVLVWGPASDYFGRKTVYLAAGSAFVAFSVVCAVAPTIEVLIAFRALQGATVAAFYITGNGVIADVWPPLQRGTAAGIFNMPLLVGPVIGPLLGGSLSQVLGWRATFFALLIFSGAVTGAVAMLLPETLQWKVLLRLGNEEEAVVVSETPEITQPEAVVDTKEFLAHDSMATAASHEALTVSDEPAFAASSKDAAVTVSEGAGVQAPSKDTTITVPEGVQILPGARPRFASPLAPLRVVAVVSVAPHAVLSGVAFACMFATLTVLPTALSQPPYSLSEALIGVSYLSSGIAGVLASPVAGSLCDDLERRTGTPAARLIPGIVVCAFLMVPGLIGFGWALQVKAGLAGLLAAHFFVGFTAAACIPGLYSYLTVIKQDQAAVAAAGAEFICFVGSGITIQTSSIGVQRSGPATFFGILAAIQLAAAIAAAVFAWRELRAERSGVLKTIAAEAAEG